MKNKSLYALLITAGVLFVLGPALAQQHDHPMSTNKEPVEVRNTICPVSGEEIGSMGEVIKHEYKGKVYNLCCGMCIKEFDKNPQKYSKIAEASGQRKGAGEKVHEHADHLKPVVGEQGEISHYTCGMHPSVKVTVKNYEKGDTKCPICFMPLTPVINNMTMGGEFGENTVSKVAIKARELKLAGVKTEPAQLRQLFKEIRAVGQVAYDPQLVVAQDEFVSAAKSLSRAREGGLQEIVDRAGALVESSRRKLLLLGLNTEQIKELEETKIVQQNLVLPEEKMWIYGDVYEYELDWIKEGAYVKVTAVNMSGEEFFGTIVSINPVIDAQTRSVRFRALVDNPRQKLRPQMYVDVEIASQYTDLQGNAEVLAIPKSALLDTGRRTIVWVDTGNGDFEGRKVEVGPETIDHSSDPRKFYPVLKGIEPGELVVTKGNFLVDSQSQITGVAASAYGGALQDAEMAPKAGSQAGHRH